MSLYGWGTPPYLILVVKAVFKPIGRAGVMVSLSWARLNFAARPPTVTDVTVRACRSSSKLDSACVAVAVIVYRAGQHPRRRVVRDPDRVAADVVAAVAVVRKQRVGRSRRARHRSSRPLELRAAASGVDAGGRVRRAGRPARLAGWVTTNIRHHILLAAIPAATPVTRRRRTTASPALRELCLHGHDTDADRRRAGLAKPLTHARNSRVVPTVAA